MQPPPALPIGLQLSRSARAVSRAFDQALAEAGGTLPVWLVLLALQIGRPANQRQLAEAVGVREATLTHHLAAMEASGLVSRRRDPRNQRVQVVEVTAAGDAAFLRMRHAAASFDRRLRAGIPAADLERLAEQLARLVRNAGGEGAAGPPWKDLGHAGG